ncbi:MAG: flagellar hook capping FlgD N-terminal domain-containing protein [Bdellovibrionota bacterium]
MNPMQVNGPSKLMWEEQQQVKGDNILGKDDFMKLLLTQLQNQDPMNPMEHEQFAAQLAQFGSLEKLSGIEEGIKKVNSGFSDEQKLQALGMIGKEVKASGSSLELKKGSAVSFTPALPQNAQAVRAMIYNASGSLVRTIDLNNHGAGAPIQWNGKDDRGQEMPSGAYRFQVLAAKSDGSPVEVGSDIKGTVVGVEVNGERPMLVVKTSNGNENVEVSKVQSVILPEKPVTTESVQTALRKRTEGAPQRVAEAAEDVVESAGDGQWDRGFRAFGPEDFPGVRQR